MAVRDVGKKMKHANIKRFLVHPCNDLMLNINDRMIINWEKKQDSNGISSEITLI